MTDDFSPEPGAVDLFGNPVEPLRDRRGRPCFRKDKANQDFVAARRAAGWSHEMIAVELGCDEKTLRKYFSRELQHGRLMVEGMCLDVLMKRAREGHTPSVRQLQERIDRVAPPAPKPKPEREVPKPEPKGKKQARLEAAARPAEDYGSLYDRIPRQ
ncbi:hypothetical protein [Rhodovulum sulfidophilum]|uniref:hypothetical protein n=1 Tax=Rhodovulum sulfidophilum TaxID=35806 RepID=UPI001F4258D9|nr:hypothetical protein [Rhodovulum sulfidophilum]MCE8438335.1 hypothetical protein [Rhodovulum sulfidophilum]